MALIFAEGFEGYASTTAFFQGGSGPAKWTSNSNSTIAINSATVRTTQVTPANSRSLQLANWGTSGQAFCNLSLPSITDTVIVGCGFLSTSTTNVAHGILTVGGTSYSNQGVSLGFNPSTGVLYAGTSNGAGQPGTVLGTCSYNISPNVWTFLEMRVKLGAATGEIEVRVNGEPALNLTNVNTATGSLTSYRTLTLLATNSNGGAQNFYFDDLYVCDATGTTNNTFLGPISVYSLMPTANASSTQLTATGVASNWDAVNDAVSDDATTYVSTNVTGNKDYYSFESLPAAISEVPGVIFKTRNNLPTAGTRKLKMNLKNGASVISSTLRSLTLGSWIYEYFVAETAPDGTAWDATKVNSTESGIEAG